MLTGEGVPYFLWNAIDPFKSVGTVSQILDPEKTQDSVYVSKHNIVPRPLGVIEPYNLHLSGFIMTALM
ncbi:MAG: hypothetical protein D4R76_02115 [Methylococcus sp.]|nr:MAG: hypothetical protein D4R76_02115 [Methylococcus sp.]